MRRPEDIPEDMWESREVLDIACKPVGARELVCRAILAERARCAKVARSHPMTDGFWIAHMIESGYEPHDSQVTSVPINPPNSAGTAVEWLDGSTEAGRKALEQANG